VARIIFEALLIALLCFLAALVYYLCCYEEKPPVQGPGGHGHAVSGTPVFST
jgi:hypothetical protein